jgi:hypothetical protein
VESFKYLGSKKKKIEEYRKNRKSKTISPNSWGIYFGIMKCQRQEKCVYLKITTYSF